MLNGINYSIMLSPHYQLKSTAQKEDLTSRCIFQPLKGSFSGEVTKKRITLENNDLWPIALHLTNLKFSITSLKMCAQQVMSSQSSKSTLLEVLDKDF